MAEIHISVGPSGELSVGLEPSGETAGEVLADESYMEPAGSVQEALAKVEMLIEESMPQDAEGEAAFASGFAQGGGMPL